MNNSLISVVKLYRAIPKKYQSLIDQKKREAFQVEHILTEPQILEHEDKFCSQKDILRFVIAFKNEEIVGGLKIMKRTINYNQKKLVLGGIAGVWTRTDSQNKGIGLMMLKKSMEFLQEEKCDVAYLCTNIEKLGLFYKKIGFHPLNKKYSFVSKSNRRFYETDGMLAPVTSLSLFKRILDDKEVFDIGRGNW